MGLDEVNDFQLFKAALAGEEAAFLALYRRWQGRIYRFSLRVSNSSSTAEDVTQEVFLALMSGGARFDPSQGPFSSYLFGMARNHVLRRMTQERRLAPIVDYPEDDGAAFHGRLRTAADLLGNLIHEERIESLHRAIAALPLRYREVVVLCELQELGYREAARVIGCPEGTIRSRLHRARSLLLEKLGEKEREDARIAGIEAARCLP